MNWELFARQIFSRCETFHPQMANVLQTFAESDDTWGCIDSMENLPFEEWETTIRAFSRIDPAKCRRLLRFIAKEHWDDGWRFHAVSLMKGWGWLDDSLREDLLTSEQDAANLELLISLL